MKTFSFISAPFLAFALLLTVSNSLTSASIVESDSLLGRIEQQQDIIGTPSAGLDATDVHPLVHRSTKSGLASSSHDHLGAVRRHRSLHKRCKKSKKSSKSSSSSSDDSDSDSKTNYSTSKSSKSSSSSSDSDGDVTSTSGSGKFTRVQENRGKKFWSGNNWNFFSQDDPTKGQVNYQDESSAKSKGLVGLTKNGAAYVRASNKDISGGNRDSVRFETKRAFDSGLVIFDVQKMPVGCGTWPALWATQGDNWPNGGEIDVMEGVGYTASGKNANQMTMHLGENSPLQLNRRALDKRASFTGRIVEGATNCNEYGSHTGCAFFDSNKKGASWGTDFNEQGGGIWAMQFGNNGGVKIWFWGRKDDDLPKELSNPDESPKKLDPSSWGTPSANFQNSVINNKVKKQTVIVNITIGGTWAGNVPLDGKCKGQNLQSAIKKGSNYDDAEFILNGIDIYCENGNC